MAQRQLQTKKIKSITRVGLKPVYDITVANKSEYVLENGVITHNTGSYYSADNIFIIGRQQEKDGKETIGYNFIINVEKSRYVKEKAKIPITVTHEGGISKWSGLLDIALETGHVIKPSNGWYQRVDMETGEIQEKKYRFADTDTSQFWIPTLTSKSFNEAVEKKYSVAYGDIIKDEDSVAGVFDVLDEE